MDPLRWKYELQANVEQTGNHARSKGFSVRLFEGQSATYWQPYPLNQIEIKGGNLDPNVRVIVSSQVTQIYFSINDIPDIEELENIIGNLGEVEQILNEVVIFAPNETTRFSMETEIPVLSYSMLRTQQKLTVRFHEALEKLEGMVLNEIVQAFVSLTRGKIAYAWKRIEVFLHELVDLQRNLIQMAKEQGIKEAEKWKEELDKSISASRQLETELASAQSPIEVDRILKKYWKSFRKR